MQDLSSLIEPMLPAMEVWSLNYWAIREVLLIPFKNIILTLVLMFLDAKYGASLVAQTVKNLLAMQETGVRSLSRKDPWVRKIPGSGRSPGEGNGYPLDYSL